MENKQLLPFALLLHLLLASAPDPHPSSHLALAQQASTSDANIVGARIGGTAGLLFSMQGISCAPSINHITSAQAPYPASPQAPQQQPAFFLPDANIVHASSGCSPPPQQSNNNNDNNLDIYTANYPTNTSPTDAVVAAYASLIQAGAFIGVQPNGRQCGTYNVPSNAAFLFFTPVNNNPVPLPQPASNVVGQATLSAFQPGNDYILVFFPTSSNGGADPAAPVCIYNKPSTSQSSQLLSTASSAGADGASSNSTSKNSNGNGSPSASKPSHTGLVIGVVAGVILLGLAFFSCCVIMSRRRKAAEENAYYKFEMGSAGRSGSINARAAAGSSNAPGATAFLTPWQMVRVGSSAKTKELDPIQPTNFRDRSVRNIPGQAGNHADSGRESVDSAHSSEIAAPMMSYQEAGRPGGVAIMRDSPADSRSRFRLRDQGQHASDDEDVVVIA